MMPTMPATMTLWMCLALCYDPVDAAPITIDASTGLESLEISALSFPDKVGPPVMLYGVS